jgi:N-acetylglucosamine-6-sulfatase
VRPSTLGGYTAPPEMWLPRTRSILLLITAATALITACQSRPSVSGSRTTNVGPAPNVVLFLTDDQRYDTLEHMPTVRRELMERGINFTNAYATTPLCCPSRASLLTGLYAHNHGVLANEGPRGGWRKFDPRSTLATWLQGGGVRTVLVGKYLNLYANEGVPVGWNEWFAIWDTGQKYYDYTVNNNGKIRVYGDKERWYSTDLLAQRAVSAVKRRPETPFFLYLAFDGPHAPATPARRDVRSFANLPLRQSPAYNEQDVGDKPSWVQQLQPLTAAEQQQIDKFRRDQLATLQSIDRAVGSVVDALREKGRLENTWLVFSSDNGISLGEHRYGGHKSCGYEECVRVPLVIAPPPSRAAQFGAPRTDHRLVLNIDIAPTIADLAGVSPDRPLDGHSIMSGLRDPQAALRTEGMLELWADDQETAFRGLRTERWKYLRYENGEQELYDLESDPYELQNLAANSDHAPLLADLSARLR